MIHIPVQTDNRKAVDEFVELNPSHPGAALLRLRGLAGPERVHPLAFMDDPPRLGTVRRPEGMPESWKLEPKYYEPYIRWRESGDPDALEELVDRLEPLIDRSIYLHIGSHDVILRTKGRAILMKTLPRYDPTKSSMSTFVYNQLLQLQREYRRQMMPLRVPERKAIEATRLKAAEEQLTAELGRPPSDVELADYTGMSLRKIRALRGGAFVSASQFSSMEGAPTEAVESKLKEDWLEYVYHSLNDRDRVIFEHTVGYNGKPVLSGNELAKKLKVSPAYISQRRTYIQRQIDRIKRHQGL